MFEVVVAELEGVVDRLVAGSVPAASGALVRVRAVIDRLEAAVCEAQVRFDAFEVWREQGAGSLRGWLRDEVGLSRTAANVSAKRSERLESWPEVAAAWSGGALSGPQVEVIVGAVPARFVGAFARDAARVVEIVSPLDVESTEQAMRQWVRCAEASDGVDDLVERGSGLFVSTTFDGRVVVSGDLRGSDAAIVEAALRVFHVADPVDESGEPCGERRTMARRNADALVAMASFALEFRDGPGDHGRFHPHVMVTMDVSELRAAALRGAGVRTVADVEARAAAKGWSAVEAAWFTDALLRHGDAITSEGLVLESQAITALSCDSVVQRVVMEGSRVLDLGREVRTATHWQRRTIIARDRHCRAPGCRTRARFCDVHHVDHWIEGGRTDVGRMVLLCGTHHREFHTPGHRMELDDHAVFTVHSPRGWSRTSVPDRTDHPAFTRTVD